MVADVKQYIRKIPIEAARIDGPDLSAETEPDPPEELMELAKWANSIVTCGHDRVYELQVPTKRGPQYARHGDWVIKNAPDNFTIMSDDEFNELYEEVDVQAESYPA